MPYELAKQLRVAGWPQEAAEEGSYYTLPIGYTFMKEEWRKDLLQPEIPCRIPTLEELIEACGKRFYGLTRDVTSRWHARSSPSRLYDEQGMANTPSEAVARLWLDLNKK